MLQCSAGSGLPAVVAACCVTVVQQGLITGSGERRGGVPGAPLSATLN